MMFFVYLNMFFIIYNLYEGFTCLYICINSPNLRLRSVCSECQQMGYTGRHWPFPSVWFKGNTSHADGRHNEQANSADTGGWLTDCMIYDVIIMGIFLHCSMAIRLETVKCSFCCTITWNKVWCLLMFRTF